MTTATELPFGITLGWVPILVVWLPLTVWLLIRVGRGMASGLSKWIKLTLLALLMAAIPLGDDAYIQWHFNRLCRDAGLRFDRKIEVEGFYDDTTGWAGVPSGFKFIESNDRVFRKLRRVERVGNTTRSADIDQPTARYHYKNPRQHEKVGLGIRVQEYVILDTQTNEIVARTSIYTRYPGWVDNLWLRFFDQTGTQCPRPGDKKRGDLRTEVLIPIGRP